MVVAFGLEIKVSFEDAHFHVDIFGKENPDLGQWSKS
jgi:hypothetical protein